MRSWLWSRIPSWGAIIKMRRQAFHAFMPKGNASIFLLISSRPLIDHSASRVTVTDRNCLIFTEERALVSPSGALCGCNDQGPKMIQIPCPVCGAPLLLPPWRMNQYRRLHRMVVPCLNYKCFCACFTYQKFLNIAGLRTLCFFNCLLRWRWTIALER